MQLVGIQDRDVEMPTPSRPSLTRGFPVPRIIKPFESSLPSRVVQNRWTTYRTLSAL